MDEKSPGRSSAAFRLDWLDILRILCALEIIGLHWLRAGRSVGLFGSAADPVSLVDVDWGDTGRGLAGLHALILPGSDWSPGSIARNTLGILFALGWQAVNVFILMSGLSLGLSYKRPDSWAGLARWYVRRAGRILPPYYLVALPIVCLGLAFLVVAGHHGGMIGHLAEKVHGLLPDPWEETLLTHVFLVDPSQPQWIAKFFSPAWWFVPAILVAYLAFPFFHLVLRGLGALVAVLLALLTTLVSYALFQAGLLYLNAWYFAVLQEAFSFMLGIVIGRALLDPSQRQRIQHLLGTWTALAAGLALFCIGNIAALFHATYAASSPLYTCGLALILAMPSVRLARSRAVVRQAKRVDAFHVYLLHQPLAFPVAVLAAAVLGGNGIVLAFPIYLLLVLAVALVFGLIWRSLAAVASRRAGGPTDRYRPADLRA
jgi:peptidoglycan/LPS O-acetylase OafA/YrhL